ncbi:MAG: endonuclease III [Bacteroidetes bacterium]|nr:endonuclease III [Bacteroidota bacterium]
MATILSQHTNDKNSHRAYTDLRKAFPTWQRLGDASLRDIEAAIRVGGMAHQKARRIRHILRDIRKRYGAYDLAALREIGSKDVLTELVGLNGVGVKTAACVLLFSLGRDIFPVDVHVHRLCIRLGMVPATASAEETFEAMSPLVPRGKAYSLHTNLIRFGRTVCRPRDPKCRECPLFGECTYKGRATVLRPQRGRSAVTHDFMLLDNVT